MKKERIIDDEISVSKTENDILMALVSFTCCEIQDAVNHFLRHMQKLWKEDGKRLL